MTPRAFVQDGRWKVRMWLLLLLIGPLYVGPCLIRALVMRRAGWTAAILLSDVWGSLITGFLTNNYRFAAALYVTFSLLEVALLAGGYEVMVIWLGDLVPALVAIYFAQQLYIKMGD